MTELRIHQLLATVPVADEPPGLGGRVRSMLRRVAEQRLDDALSEVALPSGEWCVRRLDVTMPLAVEDTDASIERQWAASIVAALRAALAGGSQAVVHYPRLADALDDLVAGLAAGRADRAWAWQQLGLLDGAEAATPGQALVGALRHRPEAAAATLVRCLRRLGIGAPHRTLGAAGWQQLAAVVAAAAGADVEALLRPSSPDAGGDPGAAGAPSHRAAAQGRPAEDRPAEERPAERAPRPVVGDPGARPSDTGVARAIAEGSAVASAVRRGGLRADAATVRAWAVLAVAEVDPAQLRRAAAPALLTELAARLGSSQPSHPGLAVPAPGSSAADRQRAGVDAAPVRQASTERGLDRSDRTAEPAGLDDPRRTATTGWAGLLFLLATAAEAGVPDALLDDDALAGRTLRWALHRIGLLLVPVAADDPAALCFAGLSPFEPPPAGEPPTRTERAALEQHAEHWANVTVARLAEPAGERPARRVLVELARRRALILADPGWIEVWLELAEVDLDIRRAGLDIDPGWLPWLGVVVRYRYD